MRKKKLLIAGVLLVGVLGGAMIASRFMAKQLLGISKVEAANVESVQFTKNFETQQSWTTSDPNIIRELLVYFEQITLVPTGSGVGGYLGIRFYLKEPIDGRQFVAITLLSPTLYMGQIGPDGTLDGYRVILGAKSDAEWTAFLNRCSK